MKQNFNHLVRWLYLFKERSNESVFCSVYERSLAVCVGTDSKKSYRYMKLPLLLVLIGVFTLTLCVRAQAQTGPVCIASLDAAVNANDTVSIPVSGIVANIADVEPVDIMVLDANGAVILNATGLVATDSIELNACNYLAQTLQIMAMSNGVACASSLTLSNKNTYALDVTDTSYWCISPEIGVAQGNVLCDLNYYNVDAPPYTSNPTISQICGEDIYLESLFDYNGDGVTNVEDARDYYCDAYNDIGLSVTDWVDNLACSSDTDYVITRHYTFENKAGNIVTQSQSIVVYNLPELAVGNFIAPSIDTMYCSYEQSVCSSTTSTYPWAQSVGLHSEATDPIVTLYYPQAQIDEAASQGTSTALVIKSDGTELSAVDIMDSTLITYNGRSTYSVGVERGDRVYVMNSNGDLVYETVGDSWFLQAGSTPTWVTLVIVSTTPTYQICDVWDNRDCADGVRIIIPQAPGSSDCDTFCINSSNCFFNYDNQSREIGSGCNLTVEVDISFEQQCVASSMDASACAIGDGSGVAITTPFGHNSIQITQRIIRIDTLAPIFVYANGCANVPQDSTVNYEAGSHSCMAEVFVPCVLLKDDCSGVDEVKVNVVDPTTGTLLSDGVIRELENSTGNRWCHSTNPFSLTPGTYEVRYSWSDSCGNMDSIDWFTLEVVDSTAPNIGMISVEMFGVDCDDTIWHNPSAIVGSVEDNCYICDTLYRRTDWMTACGVNVCLPSMAAITTTAQLETYLDSLELIFGANDVEDYYLGQYEWILDDRQCSDVVKAKLIEGWQQGLLELWNDSCVTNSLTFNSSSAIGAGWTQQIPICPEDACNGPVEVQALVFDQSGNCRIGTGTITVNIDASDTSNTCSCDLAAPINGDALTISCAAYRNLGIEDSLMADGDTSASSFPALDALLGVPQRVTFNPAGTGSANPSSSDSVSYLTMDTDFDTLLANGGGDSLVVDWDTTMLSARLPLYQADCDLTFTERVTSTFNGCSGTLTRTWTSNAMTCSNGTNYGAGAITVSQSINIGLESPKIVIHNLLDTIRDTFSISAVTFEGIVNDVINNQGSNVDDSLNYADDGQLQEVSPQLTSNGRVPNIELSTAPGSCFSFSLPYNDNSGQVELMIDTSNGAMDTVGIIIDRIYTSTATCTTDPSSGTNSFEFNRDTTKLAIVLDTTGSFSPLSIGGEVVFAISGQVRSVITDNAIQNTELQAIRNGSSIATVKTDEVGAFDLRLPEGAAVDITATKNDDPLAGIDILDIQAIQMHIQDEKVITDPYLKIAADVNADGIINTKDVIELRALTLGAIDGFSNNKSWFIFDQQTGEESMHMDKVDHDAHVNFMGIKIGDLSQDADVSRASGSVVFSLSENDITKGNEAWVTLETSTDIDGYQMALAYDPSKLDIVEVRSSLGANFWHKISDGLVRISYYGPSAEMLKVKVRAKEDMRLSETVFLDNDARFAARAVKGNAQSAPIELAYSQSTKEQFALFWSYPNPARESAFVPFRLAEEGKVTLRFFDAAGKLLKTHAANYPAGTNKYEVYTAELGATGVVYYQMSTDDYVATKRMIILD